VSGGLIATTANGVAYVNSSGALTSGSGLVFDGTNLGVGTGTAINKLDVLNGFISTYDATNANGAGYSVRYYSNANSGSRAEIARIAGLQDGAGGASYNGKIIFAVAVAGTVTDTATLTSTGLAVTGTLSATGLITTTATTGTVLSAPASSDNNRVFSISNSGATLNALFGMTAANNYVTGAGNGDFIIRNDAGNVGIAPNNAGAAYVALFSSTGLAVTGTLSATNSISSLVDMRVKLDGSDTAGSGAAMYLMNTGVTRIWAMQLSASNNYDWHYYNGSSYAKQMTLTTDNYLRLAAGGIQFNGDTAAANALNDYETGTFTPTATFATPGTVSTAGATGTYTKVGNVVTVMGRIAITKGTATGDLVLGGLPFTSVNTSLYQCSGSLSTDNFGIAGTTYQVFVAANSAAPVALAVTQATGSTVGVAAGDFYVGGGTLRYSFSYHTA
jgi:hypothetical protein